MKKYLLGLFLVLGLTACGDKADEQNTNQKSVVKIGNGKLVDIKE